MSDLIERLRGKWPAGGTRNVDGPKAADLIEAQQAEIARLRDALQEAVDVFDGMADDEINEELLPSLRAALEQKQ